MFRSLVVAAVLSCIVVSAFAQDAAQPRRTRSPQAETLPDERPTDLPPENAEFPAPVAPDAPAPRVSTAPDIRCSYHGQWGTFHLIGAMGTAGYSFDKDKFTATLEFSHEDDEYYYYNAIEGGAPSIISWAFAKLPEQSGCYAVWRRTRKGWKRYESTERWGFFGSGVQAFIGLPERVRVLENTVRTHSQILQQASPNNAAP